MSAGDSCRAPAGDRRGLKKTIWRPVSELEPLFGREPSWNHYVFCGHMWDSNPSVSVQGRSATVTLHGPFEKTGFFCRPPEVFRNLHIPLGILPDYETCLYPWRHGNLKARYGSGLNPKQSKPLFM